MRLKFTFVLAGLLGLIFAAQAVPVGVGFWYHAPARIQKQKVTAVAFGIPVYNGYSVKGASLSIIGNHSRYVNGFQFPLYGYNVADNIIGAQLGFVNIINNPVKRKPAFQIGFYNQSPGRVFQFGWVNNGQDNAKLQIGLININKNGWLPFMVFFNFGR